MVWFQCDDCGENLKKPKLQNHFRCCSASKLSCIDCGVVFDQKTVQGHTQCVSEAEKYGPKDMSCKKQATKPSSKDHKLEGVDLTLGLSIKTPWSCSLCNVKATSYETLHLHSQGKKHISKARSMSLKITGSATPAVTLGNGSTTVSVVDNGNVATCQDTAIQSQNEGMDDLNPRNIKLRSGINSSKPAEQNKTSGEVAEGTKKREAEYSELKLNKKLKHESNSESKSVKWKKLIKKTLKNAPAGSLKLKKLRKAVLSLAIEKFEKSGQHFDEASLLTDLDKQIGSYRKVIIDGQRARLECE